MESEMEWLQIFVLMAGNLATILPLWLWNRTEANADRRELRQAMDMNFKAIHDEMKDFHGRLLILEDRYLRIREKE